MRQFKLPNRDQNYLLMSVNLDSVAPMGSALRSIDGLVDSLDTGEFEKKYDFVSTQGNEPIHPKTFIKVALFAIHNCRFSLRKMEEDTSSNLGYKWLTGGVVIDHSTIGKFLSKDNLTHVLGLFSQVVLIGVEKNLVDFKILGLDTVKIRANASYKKFRNSDGIAKEKAKIEVRITELIKKATEEQSDLDDEEYIALKKRETQLNAAKQELEEREKERQAKDLRINLTDKDCQLVQQRNGEKNSGYPVTTTIDSKNDFITGFKVDELSNDAKNFFPTLEESDKNCGNTHEMIVADPGFSSMDNLEQLEKEERKALIPDRRLDVEQRGKTKKGRFDRSQFKYDEETNSYQCPEGVILEHIGQAVQNKRTSNKYANSQACGTCQCLKKCTKSSYRIVSRDISEKLKEKMRKELEKPENKEIYKKRAHMTESPFGQMKHNLKYRIFMRRGKEKVGMEFSLLCMLHNMLKIAQNEYGYMTG